MRTNEVIEETAPQSVPARDFERDGTNLTSFLEGVVERGTGTGAKGTGDAYRGKDRDVVETHGGSYQRSSYTARLRFFPAISRRWVCVVMLDNAKEGG